MNNLYNTNYKQTVELEFSQIFAELYAEFRKDHANLRGMKDNFKSPSVVPCELRG